MLNVCEIKLGFTLESLTHRRNYALREEQGQDGDCVVRVLSGKLDGFSSVGASLVGKCYKNYLDYSEFESIPRSCNLVIVLG
jgi:hypothetical protein